MDLCLSTFITRQPVFATRLVTIIVLLCVQSFHVFVCFTEWKGVPETPYWQMGYGRVQCKRCQGEPMQWVSCWQQSRAPLAALVEWQNWSKNCSVTTCTHSTLVLPSIYPNNFPPIHMLDFTQTCEWVSGLCNWLLTSELCQQNVTQYTCLAGGIYNVKTEGKKPPSNDLKANY